MKVNFILILCIMQLMYIDCIATSNQANTQKLNKIKPAYIEYYGNGSIKSETYSKNDKGEILIKNYNENGALTLELYVKNKKSLIKEYDNGILILEQNVIFDKQNNIIEDGLSKSYYKNGAIKIEQNYQNGKLDGLTKVYYENGVLKGQSYFKDDKLEGNTKSYYKSGAIETDENYKDGKLDGLTKIYYESGVLKGQSYFKNDKLEGNTKSYYER